MRNTLETTETPLEPTSGRRDPIHLRDVDGQTVYLHDGRGEIGLDLVKLTTFLRDLEQRRGVASRDARGQ